MASAIPKPEYPRPDLDRSERWLSLNGTWDFESIDGAATITVPFAWESEASGIGRSWLASASYRRGIVAPAEWEGSRVFLCFGAVHHRATVSIDGTLIGTHEGGYTSFEFDVTDALRAGVESELTVEVDAPADKRSIPHGKQRSLPRDDYDGVSFAPSSGIWQSAWLEARGRSYVSEVSLRGDSLNAFEVAVTVCGDAAAAASVAVSVVGATQGMELVTDATGRATGILPIDEPRLWSPEDPHLYELEIRVADDRLVATAGLRSFETRGEQLYLNGERFYLKGVLDQGYWPASGITAPDDHALVRDLELARDAGYNLVRKHLKFEEPRWLHWADRLGMLVWAEPASTSRFSAQAAANFEAQIAEMVTRDGNHPSIVIWGLYNEEWGLDWDIPGDRAKAEAAGRAYELLAALDHTRPIVENSGWAHVKTDLVDWHYYDEKPGSWAENVAALASGERHDFPVPLGPAFVVDKSLYADATVPRGGIPLLNSEYGGGFTSLERGWHLRWQTQELRRHDRFAGYVYTELADVEHESAGIVTAERRTKDLGGLDPADANAETVLVLDVVPVQAGTDIALPTGELTLGVRVSHHGRSALSGRIRAAWAAQGEPFGAVERVHEVETAVTAHPFEVTDAAVLSLTVPAASAAVGSATAARLHVWLTDADGAVRARTFLDAGPLEERRS
ncbi:glycoside hydrolase family 2 protein [Leifsonia sp. Root112D2]|uniref:glycoside hydrolase family 2 protein n=1 Tax=Leifsonia sp. Root112D2 TaxID=1736426 RepID=UPI0006F6AC2A|nr:glycoside hydrolase family 2 [Leifsonia sp. Root112D2]KQV06980.1 glycosyl hydrolase family 2 [Leifsonia sp. Root112D2]